MMFLDDIEEQDPTILEKRKKHFDRLNNYIVDAFAKKLQFMMSHDVKEKEKISIEKHE